MMRLVYYYQKIYFNLESRSGGLLRQSGEGKSEDGENMWKKKKKKM